MTSEVDICNLALANIGSTADISSLDENSTEAAYCKAFYAPARDAVLRAHDWNFARKRVALSDLGSPPPDWLYRYQHPTDCVNALKIINTVSRDPIPFEVSVNDALDGKVILTNQATAYLRYTARVTDPILFDAEFVDALSWNLAYRLAPSITGDDRIQEKAFRIYRAAVSAAETTDANEGEAEQAPESELITVRY